MLELPICRVRGEALLVLLLCVCMPVMDITRDLFTEQECLRWSKRKAVTIP